MYEFTPSGRAVARPHQGWASDAGAGAHLFVWSSFTAFTLIAAAVAYVLIGAAI